MRLLTRVYLAFCKEYDGQEEICVKDLCNNASDIFRKDVISLLGKAVTKMCERSEDDDEDSRHISITQKKSGLKISILNLLKYCGKLLIGHFLSRNNDESP